MVRHSFQEDLLPVEFESELLGELQLAYSELLLRPVRQHSVRPDLHLYCVQAGAVRTPQARGAHLYLRQRKLLPRVLGQVIEGGGSLAYKGSVRRQNARLDGGIVAPEAVHLHLHRHRGAVSAHFRRVNIHAVVVYVRRVLHLQIYIPEQSASGVPARSVHLSGIGIYGHQIVLAQFQIPGDIHLESNVPVLAGSHLCAVYIHVPVIHYSIKLQEHFLSLPRFVRAEGLAVPALAHRLEPAPVQGRVLRPRLLPLEVVREVQAAPGGVVQGGILRPGDCSLAEFPVKVEKNAALLRKALERRVGARSGRRRVRLVLRIRAQNRQ